MENEEAYDQGNPMTIREQVRQFCEQAETCARQQEHKAEKIEISGHDSVRIAAALRSDLFEAESIVRRILDVEYKEQGCGGISGMAGIDNDGDDDFPVACSLFRIGSAYVIVAYHPIWDVKLDRIYLTTSDYAVIVFSSEESARTAMAGYRAINTAWRLTRDSTHA